MRGALYRRNFVIVFLLSCVSLVVVGNFIWTSNVAGIGKGSREKLTTRSVSLTNTRADKPLATVHFSKQVPASAKPMLMWTKVKGAVAYEIELLSESPENPNGTTLSKHGFFTTKQVYVPGFNADVSNYLMQDTFYWRVRGLDFSGKAIGVFSDAELVYVDRRKDSLQKPTPTSIFNQSVGSTLLYPVYAWIPVAGADKYEVEILNDLPENPNGIAPSRHRIDAAVVAGFDYYDETPRISEKPFYWRVRGLDQAGNPVGVYSDAGQYSVNPAMPVTVATFGDSITHGGGSVSYSPADWEYSYQHYLDFPTVNLGKSGDTSATMVERFDQDVLPFQPRYLLILAGTNSLRGGVEADHVIEDLKVLQEKCLANNIRPIFLTLPPINPENIEKVFNESTVPDWNNKMKIVNEFIRSQIYIDITTEMDDAILPGYLAVDGLHLDIKGKKKIAAAINTNWQRITQLSR
ncbi:SGNH/GDSL hydrolase family protein [Sporomusa aerivorans]|uniref:SGNH/GDSL hydrolase family protein n=1 Tax=Sporomusa aerivorans TaxID=204936 RepID=UPI00352B657E